MSLFKKVMAGGLANEIRCDEESYLVWKWSPEKSLSENSGRGNAIRWGSSLRVKEGEVAVFVYKQEDGSSCDFIEGPTDKILYTDNLPVLANILGIAYDGGTPFQAEVYFINLEKNIQVNFGVPYFDVYDPRFMDFGVPVAVRGTISFCINDYREFIKLHRLNSFDLESFQKQIKDAVIRYTKDVVANAPSSNNISVLQLETKIAQINDAIEYDISIRMKEQFGVDIKSVDISAIEIDKTSDSFKQFVSVTKDVAAIRVHAETQDYTERLAIKREEEWYAARKRTQSANLNAFTVEKQAEVGIASAEALGKMGATEATNINMSNGSLGLNPAAMTVGMTLGGAIGRNIVDSMNITNNSAPIVTPPPLPSTHYFIAIDGQTVGPYELPMLIKMVTSGELRRDTLVWKKGMENWDKAENQQDIKDLFEDNMKSIPPVTDNKR